MKLERCKCCFSVFKVSDYTRENLRERILEFVQQTQPTPDDIILFLSQEGFHVKDIKREFIWLFDSKLLQMTSERCTIVSENNK